MLKGELADYLDVDQELVTGGALSLTTDEIVARPVWSRKLKLLQKKIYFK
jgi:hypothetical protein